MKNIALIGMPGCGKSVIGAALAKKWRRRFCDVDGEIEKRSRLSIADIFANGGESFFRQYESRVLAEVLQDDNLVISTGGGIITTAKNRKLLREKTVAVFLSVPLPILMTRLKNNRRPLLAADAKKVLPKLWRRRQSLYQQTAAITVRLDEPRALAHSVGIVMDAVAGVGGE